MCLESISLGLLQGTNTRCSKLRARTRKLMNASGTLLFFIFVYLEFSTFLKFLRILSAVISTPSFSTDLILCFLSFGNSLKSHQLMATFLDLLPFKKNTNISTQSPLSSRVLLKWTQIPSTPTFS